MTKRVFCRKVDQEVMRGGFQDICRRGEERERERGQRAEMSPHVPDLCHLGGNVERGLQVEADALPSILDGQAAGELVHVSLGAGVDGVERIAGEDSRGAAADIDDCALLLLEHLGKDTHDHLEIELKQRRIKGTLLDTWPQGTGLH